MRMRVRFITTAALLGALGAPATTVHAQNAAAGKPLKSGIDKTHVDAGVRPQDDLFVHVNGKWLKGSEIPADRSSDGAFYKLRDDSEAAARQIIEAAAAKTDNSPGSEAQKVGDLYASFMDEAKIESLGIKPIADELAAVDAIADTAALTRALGAMGRLGVPGPFAAFVDTDPKRSDRYIVQLNQGGIGLPDEAYYRDEKFAPIRKAYLAHIAKMLTLAGVAEPEAAAQKVFDLETRLAKAHWDRVTSRDDTKTYNLTDRAKLSALTPGFDWAAYLGAVGAPKIDEVVVRQPSYFTAMAEALTHVPLADWKLWLKWQTLRAYAPYLSKPFADESFAFYGKTLTGAQEIRPRWKRAVGAVEGALGEAVGKLYVEKNFPPAAKAKMQTLVANLIEAYRLDIESLDWMSPETKKRAIEKLRKFTPKIGYPDKWRDYSKLAIERGDLIGNLQRADAFELDRNLAKLGGPVDRSEWGMTPQTVNAYYNPGMNEIVFPAAILMPPFFDLEADDAVNYGGIGAVIGHEIGHGFDDQGSKYDGDGNMKDWWTESDRKEFDARGKKLIEQYNAFEPAQLPGQKVNGALTIGENIGDLGGLTIALKAYKLSLDGKEAPVIDGLTGPQRFFIGWAQVWRGKNRDAELQRRLATDPHSPAEFRCNGVVRNVPEFYEAFGLKPGDKLYLAPADRVTIW